MIKKLEEPKGKGQATGFEDSEQLARLENLERDVKAIKQLLDFVKNTNWVVIIVLFVALLALILSAIYANSQSFSESVNSRMDLINEVNQLQHDLNEYKFRNTNSTPTPTP